jgi:hypothetical protein
MIKDLFLMMREQEIQTSNFLPNKKEIQFSAKKFITDILDAGETDKFELLAQAKRMVEALDIINLELMKVIPQENFEAFGLKGTFRSGGDTANYMEDEVYATIKKDLDNRNKIHLTLTEIKCLKFQQLRESQVWLFRFNSVYLQILNN